MVGILNTDGMKFCPFIKGEGGLNQCHEMVNKFYFNEVCNSPSFAKCRKFSEIIESLDIPFHWLQKMAVEREMTENQTQTQSGIAKEFF